jgi:hypothetical protein
MSRDRLVAVSSAGFPTEALHTLQLLANIRNVARPRVGA